MLAIGGTLVWAGRQLITSPEKILPAPACPETPKPVLNPLQHKLLQRIWDLQIAHNAKHLIILLNGPVAVDRSGNRTERINVDLKVELFDGDPVPEEEVHQRLEDLLDSLPSAYVDYPPSRGMRFGPAVTLSVSEEGVRYLRGSAG